MKYAATIGERTLVIEVNRDGEVVIDGESYPIDLRAIDDETFSLIMEHASHEALVELAGDEVHVMLNGRLYQVQVLDERARRLAPAGGGGALHAGEVVVKSPMPGLIVAVPVAEGEVVKKGQTVVVLESMKMENELKAPRDGTVASIKVAPRQNVEQHQSLVIIV